MVDEGHGRTGPVDLHVPARLAADPAHDVPADRELPVPLAEAVVGHRRLAPAQRILAVLAVQETERDADLRRVQCRGDHVERQVRRRQPEHHPRRYPSRQDQFLSLDYRYGVSSV